MDKERAKEFLFYDMDNEKIYISKDLQKLIDLNDGSLISIFGVVDTKSGEKLFEMDFAYSGEPILMRVFLHKQYFMDYHYHSEVINL